MSLEILRDPRVRSVPWRDLLHVNGVEVVTELCLSLPWLGLSLALAHVGWYGPALLASFVFFLTGLRQAHNAFHYAVGIPRRATEWLMFVLSVLMLGSMHAIQVVHLRHHQLCMSDDDVEAMSARMSGLRALLLGPWFPWRLHCKALEVATVRQRHWILFELLANVVWIVVVFGWLDWAALRYHVLAMAVGQCGTAFFAVWTVHHDCDRSHFIARTLRTRWKNRISFGMFFHVEHHLFPRVPTCHLPALAERIDRWAPELQEKQVF
jgi:fatty acid desaturase